MYGTIGLKTLPAFRRKCLSIKIIITIRIFDKIIKLKIKNVVLIYKKNKIYQVSNNKKNYFYLK